MKTILKLCGLIVIIASMLGISNLWFSTIVIGNLWIHGPLMAIVGTALLLLGLATLIWTIPKLIKL